MTARRTVATTIAVALAALATFTSATTAGAHEVDGHEFLPLTLVTDATPAHATKTNVTMVAPGTCPAQTLAMASLSRPGDELDPAKWIRLRQTFNLGYSGGPLSSAVGLAQGDVAKAAYNEFLLSYDTTWSYTVSCVDATGTALAAGTPVWITSLHKLSQAESTAAGVTAGHYTVVPYAPPVVEGSPSAPTGLTVTPGISTLTATWAPVAASPAVTGYAVSVTDPSGTPVTGSPFVTAAGVTTAVVSGLTPGVSYSVSVTATNSLGSSPVSATAQGTPPVVEGTGDITAEVTVPVSTVGTITLAVPASGKANLGTAAEQTDGTFKASGKLGTVTVTDGRAAASQSAWSVQATVANFASAQTPANAFSFAQLGSKPVVTGTGVTKGADQVVGGAAAVRKLATGAAGASGTVDADLDLVVPKGTPAGTYSSKITIDLVKG